MSREILDTINTIFSSSNDAICIHVRCRKVSSNHIVDPQTQGSRFELNQGKNKYDGIYNKDINQKYRHCSFL